MWNQYYEITSPLNDIHDSTTTLQVLDAKLGIFKWRRPSEEPSEDATYNGSNAVVQEAHDKHPSNEERKLANIAEWKISKTEILSKCYLDTKGCQANDNVAANQSTTMAAIRDSLKQKSVLEALERYSMSIRFALLLIYPPDSGLPVVQDYEAPMAVDEERAALLVQAPEGDIINEQVPMEVQETNESLKTRTSFVSDEALAKSLRLISISPYDPGPISSPYDPGPIASPYDENGAIKTVRGLSYVKRR